MAATQRYHRKITLTTVLLLICIESSLTKSVKANARPVHEPVNEQTRSDPEKTRPSTLHYGNPLAGNSQKNARQHALHQQAMFNAERNRQHRAQLQRWTTAPQQMDSYMKAYHESQESHHLDLERQQAKLKDAKNKDKHFTPIPVTAAPQTKLKSTNNRPEASKRIKNESLRISKADAIRNKQDKSRNHRSYGSADYYAHPGKYQTVYVNPSANYDQGVTIKPNGNIGVAAESQTSQLYTQSIPSTTQYVYPKQYSQMQGYQSAHDIASLSSLLKKTPNDQLSEFNALIQSSKHNNEEPSTQEVSPLHQPIDLYFYLKDTPTQSVSGHYDSSKYAQVPQNYAEAYTTQPIDAPKDHTPITEEIDDIADPNKPTKVTSYGIQTILTPQTQPLPDTATIKSNNYYKVEVASQTISSGYKPSYHTEVKQPVEYVLQHETEEEHKPSYQALQYGHQPVYYNLNEHTDADSGDKSERYLHHNAQFKGVQHLTGDGTGVSAYGDNTENLHYAANYEFGYRVRDHHTGNDFGHHEAKDGEKTNGHYHVLLPDGRMQKVKYWAGPSGFHADISYDHLQEHQT